MALGEFALIDHFFKSIGNGEDVLVGIGDDAAILKPTAGKQLVTAIDTLVAGVHFPAEADSASIASRCLRVNLSDFAAMGATPKWFTLALTLPESDEQWLEGFARGLAGDAATYACALVGGDTTRGPLTISIAMFGEVDAGKGLLRSGARAGDAVYVTGPLGGAAAALELLGGTGKSLTPMQQQLLHAYYFPEPRLAAGQALLDIASSAIDISDGLLADAGHIAGQSGAAIELEWQAIPLAEPLKDYPLEKAMRLALTGGDDYELCFTVPGNRTAALQRLLETGVVKATRIGRVAPGSGVRCIGEDSQTITVKTGGYRHF